MAALTRRSCAVHTEQAACSPTAAEQWRALRQRRPRDFGHKTSPWTLDLAAAEAPKQGLTATRVTGEMIRATLARLAPAPWSPPSSATSQAPTLPPHANPIICRTPQNR